MFDCGSLMVATPSEAINLTGNYRQLHEKAPLNRYSFGKGNNAGHKFI